MAEMDMKEKLVELLSQIQSYGVKQGSHITHQEGKTNGEIASHLIANGVTVQEWIPVTERLPEVATSHNTRWDKSTDSIRVLCACVQADGKKMVKEGYCKVYSDGFVHWKIPGTIHSVTHWQYLPQPPKGE